MTCEQGALALTLGGAQSWSATALPVGEVKFRVKNKLHVGCKRTILY